MKKAFVVINPTAGQSDHNEVSVYIQQNCQRSNWQCEIYLTTGGHVDQENLESAKQRDYDLFVAAGGDGTVALVANAVIDTDIPVGIIPIGTGNGAARVAQIPLEWKQAVDLLFDENDVYEMDVFKVGGHHFLLHMGVGISGVALRDPDIESKRVLGRLYYPFEALRSFFGFQPHLFEVTIDGQSHRFRGQEVFVINSASIGDPFIRWSDSIQPTDGILDVFFLRARTFAHLLRLAWNTILGRQRLDPGLRYHRAKESIHIRSEPTLPLQADGEYVTETPSTVELLPKAVKLVSLSRAQMDKFGTTNA